MRLGRIFSGLFALAAVAVIVAESDGNRAEAAAEPCPAWDVTYALAARLRLDDTPMGSGNGVYNVGPGELTLRVPNPSGRLQGPVTLSSYQMQERFTVNAKALFWTTTVVTDAVTKVTPDRCHVAARGVVDGRTLRWTTGWSGYRTDGTMNCAGTMCGKFGAPPPGKTPLRIGPHTVTLRSFQFSPDMSTFTMESTQVAKTEMPKQTAYLVLSGREVRRSCAPANPCP